MTNKLAFVFPGQGSQKVGMLKELSDHYPSVKETFDLASAILGFDAWDVVQNGPEQALNKTETTQPVLLAAGYATWQVWQDRHGRTPDVVAGHSLGEYTALVCAGAMDLATGIDLVAKRGQYMAQAMVNQQGSMAAIVGLDSSQIQAICQEAAQGESLAAANYNSPDQTVIAGHKTAIARAMELANQKGARLALELPVSVPCHCSLMQPAADKLRLALENAKINTPKIPVLHNVDVAMHQDPEEIRQVLVQQLYSPVHWTETIQKLAADGVGTIIECGPGKVLSGLNKRIDRNLNVLAINDTAGLEQALTS